MSRHGVLRSPASAALLVDLAAEHGMRPADTLRGTPLTREALDDIDAEVPFRDELRIIANILDTLDDPPGLGIEAGLRCHAASPGVWGFALMSAGTLRDAMSVGVSLAALSFCLCRLIVTPDAATGSFRLVLDPTGLPIGIRRFAVERDSTGIRTLQRDLLGASDVALRVTYTMAQPSADLEQQYIAVFGGPPVFGAPDNSLSVDAATLDRPLPGANEHSRSMAEDLARDLLRQRSARAGVAGLMRDLMLSNTTPALSLDEAARQLTVSARTLRRHLALEGVSLRTLQEEAREALAEQLLAADENSVAEIANRLGYSQVSSFTQAFRRWKGVGPREYRLKAPAR